MTMLSMLCGTPYFLEDDSIEDTIYVTDYSTNGTWVNGYRLNRNQVYAVEKGSMVVLANQKCSFKVGVTYQ